MLLHEGDQSFAHAAAQVPVASGVGRTDQRAQLHGLPVPDEPVRVELTAPDGDRWTWGSGDTNRITGSALDFCLVVTQRRNIADTGLVVAGPVAQRWMSVAQAFAGPPAPGRQPEVTR